MTISARVCEFLANKPPLTVITLDELYHSIQVEGNERHAARAALYHHAIGSLVAKRNKPKAFYAIRFPVSNLGRFKYPILSLPGIPKDHIIRDAGASPEISMIIKRLKDTYGRSAIDYWCRAAQYRSVDQARTAMKIALRRDQHSCRLCKIIGIQQPGLLVMKPKPVQASHIVSRKTIFWLILDKIDKGGISLFSDQGAESIQKELEADPYNNKPDFIITLCREHDKMLSEAIKRSIQL